LTQAASVLPMIRKALDSPDAGMSAALDSLESEVSSLREECPQDGNFGSGLQDMKRKILGEIKWARLWGASQESTEGVESHHSHQRTVELHSHYGVRIVEVSDARGELLKTVQKLERSLAKRADSRAFDGTAHPVLQAVLDVCGK